MRLLRTSTFLAVLLALGSAAGAEAPADAVPTSRISGFALMIHEFEAEAKVDFKDKTKTEYEVSMKGVCRTPTEEDVVGIGSRFTVVSARDADGKELKKPSRYTRFHRGIRSGGFTGINDHMAAVEIPSTKLIDRVFKLRSLVVENEAIVAKKRVASRTPAVVMEDAADLQAGLKVRITSLRMSSNRELTLTATYTRTTKGTKGAFIEAVYAINEDGEVIGGGRWDTGSPFGTTGSLTWRFRFAKAQAHKFFRFDIVTEYTLKKVQFTVSDLFQK